MHKALLLLVIVASQALSSCASYYPQNLEGKRLDANSPICRQLLTESRNLLRPADYDDDPLFSYTTDPIGFVPVTDAERHGAFTRYTRECETQSAYNKRTKLDLLIDR